MRTPFPMSRRVTRKNAGLATLLTMVALFTGPLLSQEATTDDTAKAPAVRKKAAGRLPTYFSSVVSPKQREAIYKVQAGYEAQLEKLRAEIAALIADRDREVDAVLSEEQLAEVTKKRDEAKKRRAARSSAKASTKKTTGG